MPGEQPSYDGSLLSRATRESTRVYE
jgi:hypothetical protein